MKREMNKNSKRIGPPLCDTEKNGVCFSSPARQPKKISAFYLHSVLSAVAARRAACKVLLIQDKNCIKHIA